MGLLAPSPPVQLVFYDNSGLPLNGGYIYTVSPGTTAPFGQAPAYPMATFADALGQTENPNPVITDTAGRAPIFLTGPTKFVIYDKNGNLIQSMDNVSSTAWSVSTGGQWAPASTAITYSSSTVFTTPGDQTELYAVGVRVQANVAAGVIYGTVTASSSAGSPLTTTVTVAWDSGQLDGGLSSVAVGILSTSKSALPAPPVYISNFASLSAAITALGSAPTELLINVPTTVPTNTTVPVTVSITVAEGGLITEDGGTLTINGPFRADKQAFSGFSGSDITWGGNIAREIKAEWFYAGSGTWDTAIQAANDSIVASANHVTVLRLPASCSLDTGVSIDVSFARMKGDNTHIDATALTTGAAITLAATSGLNQWIDGLEGVNLIGDDVAGTVGISIQASYACLRDVIVSHFAKNIQIYSHAYQNNFFNVTSIYADTLFEIPAGGTDYGTEYRFFGCNLFGQRLWQVYAAAGTGSDIDFFGCSFNYADATATNARWMHIDGMKVHLYGCHVEQSLLSNLDATVKLLTTDPGTGADASSAFTMSGGHLAIGDDTATYNAASIFDCDSNYPYGVNITIAKDVMMNCYCTGGTLITTQSSAGIGAGRFEFDVNPIHTQLSYFFGLISEHASADVMIDGGFETGILDNVYVSGDGGGITDRLSSSTVTISKSGADKHTGSYSLAVAKSSGASAVGNARIAIPIRGGERPYFAFWVKSAQDFNVWLQWGAIYTQGGVTGQTVITEQKIENIVDISPVSASDWTKINPASFALGGGHYHSLPAAPGWATHFVIEIDALPGNNTVIYVDDLIVNIAK